MSRIEQALRRAQLAEAEAEPVPVPARFCDIDTAMDVEPAPFLDMEAELMDAVQQVAAPVEPVVAPAKPIAAPAERVVAPAERVAAPAERVAAPAEPVIAPSKPVAAPAEPVIAPAKPVAVATKPASAPVKPAAASAKPAAASRPLLPAPEPARAPLSDKLIVSAGADHVAVEQYRKLAAVLHHLQTESGTKIIMIGSAQAGEGKTLTAANVALTLSQSFRRSTLLIDADLRRPTLHTLLNVPNVTGLNDVLEAREDRKLTIVEVAPGLSVLPAGRPNPDPMSGLTSPRMRAIVQEASAKFDWVILDTPPIELLPDASLLAEMVDGVILVVGAGRTPFRSIERAVQIIDRKRIFGVVLNRAVYPKGRSYGYGYGHYNGGAVAH